MKRPFHQIYLDCLHHELVHRLVGAPRETNCSGRLPMQGVTGQAAFGFAVDLKETVLRMP